MMFPRPPTSALFPYTTLFRSRGRRARRGGRADGGARGGGRGRAGRGRGRRGGRRARGGGRRSEEHTSELQSHVKLVCRLLLDKKNSSKRRSCRCIRPSPTTRS